MTKQEFLNNFAQKEKPKYTTSAMPFLMESIKEAKRNGIESVSYTHLTLPTNSRV